MSPFGLLSTTSVHDIFKTAIQVAPRPRKGKIPPESVLKHRASLLFCPRWRTPGHKGEDYASNAA